MWKGSDGIGDRKVMQNKFGWEGRIVKEGKQEEGKGKKVLRKKANMIWKGCSEMGRNCMGNEKFLEMGRKDRGKKMNGTKRKEMER